MCKKVFGMNYVMSNWVKTSFNIEIKIIRDGKVVKAKKGK
jgi:hypothetical protein